MPRVQLNTEGFITFNFFFFAGQHDMAMAATGEDTVIEKRKRALITAVPHNKLVVLQSCGSRLKRSGEHKYGRRY